MKAERRLMTVAGAADWLGCDPDKIRALIRSGQLPATNIALKPNGRPRYRIHPLDLETFLQRRSIQPQTVVPCHRRRRRQHGDVIEFF